MELSLNYKISQVFVIIAYILLGITYYAKDRNKILLFNFLSLISNGIAFFFLEAWTGIAMVIVAIIRNIIFMIDEKKNGKSQKIYKKDIAILLGLYCISIVFTIFTYDGFFSLLSVFATMLYTFSVWQKDTKTYKLLGIPIEILCISYNIYIKSIFGIVLESILAICSFTGYILEYKKFKTEK